MPVYTSEALILRTYKLGEVDRIVVFLTRDRGKKRGVAKGARRARSRFIGGLEPMTRAGVAYYEREQRDLVRINYVEPTRSPLSASSGDALGHVGYFAELIDEWAPEAHADERLYRLGAAMTDAIASGAAVEPLARPLFAVTTAVTRDPWLAVELCAIAANKAAATCLQLKPTGQEHSPAMSKSSPFTSTISMVSE